MNPRVAVVGGGIAGLATAFRLQRAGVEPVVLERAGTYGGLIAPPVPVGDLDLEPGPDSLAARKPWGSALCRDLGLVLVPPLGALSDRVGRKPLLLTACACFALLTYPLFVLMNTGNLVAAILAHLALAVIEAIFISTSIAVMTELFPTRVRYGGYSIGYNFSVAIFGGSAPFLATWLISVTGNPLSPAFYVIFAAVATLLTVLMRSEPSGCGPSLRRRLLTCTSMLRSKAPNSRPRVPSNSPISLSCSLGKGPEPTRVA